MTDTTTAFEGIAAEYERWRPDYPVEALAPLVEALAGLDRPRVVDVGAGTGISTRLLRRAFGPRVSIVGVEPGRDMREQARRATPAAAAIEYVEGTAETLPIPSGGAGLVIAAQAYQWFDRPAFLREAHRVLGGCGVLAVLHNDRDWRGGGLTAAYEDFLERHSPGYTRTYRSFDVRAEIARAGGFEPADQLELRWTRTLAAGDFPSFALTSSKAQAAARQLGGERAAGELLSLAQRASDRDGNVAIPYVTCLTWARRAA